MPYFEYGDTSGSIAAPIVLDQVSVSGAVFLGNIGVVITASTWGAGVSGSSSGSILWPLSSASMHGFNGSSWEPVKVAAGGYLQVTGTVTPSQISLNTSVITNTAATISAVTMSAANVSRKQWSLYNGSDGSVYVKLGTGALTSSYTLIVAPGGYYELPATNGIYTGVITAIWGVTSIGSASITEIS